MTTKTQLKEGAICLNDEFTITKNTTIKDLEEYTGLIKLDWQDISGDIDGYFVDLKIRQFKDNKHGPVESYYGDTKYTEMDIPCAVEGVSYVVTSIFNEQDQLKEVSLFPYTPEIEAIYKEIRPLRKAGMDYSPLQKKVKNLQLDVCKQLFFSSIKKEEISEENVTENGLENHCFVANYDNLKISLSDDKFAKGWLYIYYL